MTVIAIIGVGLIGRAWATIFASHGFDVAIYDPAPGAAKAARAHIGRNLKELAGHGLVDDPAQSLKRIRVATDLADAEIRSTFRRFKEKCVMGVLHSRSSSCHGPGADPTPWIELGADV